jgi:hypothetical protein
MTGGGANGVKDGVHPMDRGVGWMSRKLMADVTGQTFRMRP